MNFIPTIKTIVWFIVTHDPKDHVPECWMIMIKFDCSKSFQWNEWKRIFPDFMKYIPIFPEHQKPAWAPLSTDPGYPACLWHNTQHIIGGAQPMTVISLNTLIVQHTNHNIWVSSLQWQFFVTYYLCYYNLFFDQAGHYKMAMKKTMIWTF